jgi:hypothetical protein
MGPFLHLPTLRGSLGTRFGGCLEVSSS